MELGRPLPWPPLLLSPLPYGRHTRLRSRKRDASHSEAATGTASPEAFGIAQQSTSPEGSGVVQDRRLNQKTFFGELKRRNVYKVAVAYIVGGWALAQERAQA